MRAVDHTHQREATSWIESANAEDCLFPIQNLPFCVFRKENSPRIIGVGIGDQILDLRACREMLSEELRGPVSEETLAGLMALPVAERVQLRHELFDLLKSDSTASQSFLRAMLTPMNEATYCLPCSIRDYTDFYCSVYHATNVGLMFRPNNPLLPNYKHIPIGYHGRASSIVTSGTEVRRPVGQKAPSEEGGSPTRSPAALLDYELEVGFFVAQGNELGETIPIEKSEDFLFGMCLVNDWSARDIQKWEYQPLGPFLAKSFATSISPWVVTMEALAPFRAPALTRETGDPEPLDYLQNAENEAMGGVDIQLAVKLASEKMRNENVPPQALSTVSFTNMYWTVAQMLTHHASNGCNLQPGDMMASGTVSGPSRDQRGCLLELTWDGDKDNPVPGSQRTPLVLPTGEERKFLQDGDEVIFEGHCEREGYRSIGFGECRGTVVPAKASS